MLILGFLFGIVAVLSGAAATAYLYERISIRSTTNFAVAPVKTPLEILEETPPEPAFSEAEFKAMFLNDDEEDIKHMLESGRITEEQVPDILDALGISNEIQFG